MSRSENVTRLEPSERPVFCVEGGGTHSRGALHAPGSAGPSEIFEGGRCNPSTGFDAAVESVGTIWERVSEGTGLKRADVTLAIGTAGINPAKVRGPFCDALGDFGRIVPLSDGYAALVGCGDGEPCGMVVAGTGCAGHRLRPDGVSIQRDGWGWIGGDRGSGAWIGLKAIGHSLSVRDGLVPGDELSEAVLGHLGGESERVAGWLSACNPSEIASLSRHVFRLAEEGMGLAKEILSEAASHLRDLFKSLGCAAGEPLYLSGSIAEALCERIGEGMETKPVAKPGMALHGSWLVARGVAPLEWPPEA